MLLHLMTPDGPVYFDSCAHTVTWDSNVGEYVIKVNQNKRIHPVGLEDEDPIVAFGSDLSLVQPNGKLCRIEYGVLDKAK